jgi:hypothetical protein
MTSRKTTLEMPKKMTPEKTTLEKIKTRNMTSLKSILLLTALALLAALTGCSSSSSTPPPPITVTLSTIGSTLTVNSQTLITAAVANDPVAGSVTWSCTPSSSCGTFNPTTTTTGVATTYTAPATVTSGVVITAALTGDTSVFASTSTISIAGATLADGNYVFSLNGSDTDQDFENSYSVSGVFTISGGAVTGGEQDFVDFYFADNDQINPTGSSVTTTADGNLQITLALCNGTGANACAGADTNIGVSGVETLAGSVLPMNTNKALITEFDDWATSSGELNAQDTAAAAITPSGGYAFGVNGSDGGNAPLSIGGIINVDGSGTISGAGSVFDLNDTLNTGLFQGETFTASTVSAPDSFGRVTFTLSATDTADFNTGFVFVGYIVDSSKIRLVETFDGYAGSTGGTAFSQTGTGGFTTASVSGNSYVVGLNGFDTLYALQAAGLFTLNADGTVGGFINYNDNTGTGVQAPSAITGGTYLIDSTGRVTLSNITSSILENTVDAQFYLDGNGNLLALSMDTGDVLGGRGFQQSGGGAFTASSFSGPYGFDATGVDYSDGAEIDGVGPILADGVGTFAGFADVNWIFSVGPTYPDAPVTAAFTAASNGIFTGTITGVDADTCSLYGFGTTTCSADAFAYYMIDATGDNIAIETDPNQVTLGYFVQQ